MYLFCQSLLEQILTRAAITNFDEALTRLLCHTATTTQSMRSEITHGTSVMVSMSQSRSDSKGGRGITRGRGQCPQCTYRHRLGHTCDRCYQLHGRPPCTAHLAQSFDHLTSSSSISRSSPTPQGVVIMPNEYEDYLCITQADRSSTIASFA